MFIAGTMMGQSGRVGDLARVFFISEAWMSLADEEGPRPVPPSSDPRRIEVLIISGLELEKDQTALVLLEMVRDLMDQSLLTPPEDEPFFQPFVATTVCRGDMINYFDDDEIAQFSDADMTRLAQLMGELYLDRLRSGFYEDIETIGKMILEEKRAGEPPESTA